LTPQVGFILSDLRHFIGAKLRVDPSFGAIHRFAKGVDRCDEGVWRSLIGKRSNSVLPEQTKAAHARSGKMSSLQLAYFSNRATSSTWAE
jgi:hypothetical protein